MSDFYGISPTPSEFLLQQLNSGFPCKKNSVAKSLAHKTRAKSNQETRNEKSNKTEKDETVIPLKMRL
jgi:hypothetical protein